MRKPSSVTQETNKGAKPKREEGGKFVSYAAGRGEGRRRTLPRTTGPPCCCQSCRTKWMDQKPEVKKENFTEAEEDLMIKLHALLGNRWSLIAGRLPGRTDDEVKNYWNCHLRKNLPYKVLDGGQNRRLGLNTTFPATSLTNHGPPCSSLPGVTMTSTHACTHCTTRLGRVADDGVRLSDEASSNERNVLRLPDLNVKIPDISSSLTPEESAHRAQDEAVKMNREVDDDDSPALPLFR